MTISSTDFLIEQSPGANGLTAGKAINANTGIVTSSNFLTAKHSQANNEHESDDLAQQAPNFSVQLSIIQQKGNNLRPSAGNKLPLSGTIHTNPLPENSNQQKAGDAYLVRINKELNLEGLELVDLVNFDIQQAPSSETGKHFASTAGETEPTADVSFTNLGKISTSDSIELVLDTNNVNSPALEELVNNKRSGTSIAGIGNSGGGIPIVGSLDYQVSSRPQSFQQSETGQHPANSVSEGRFGSVGNFEQFNHSFPNSDSGVDNKLEVENFRVNPNVKTKITSESLISNNLGEQLLDTSKFSGIKNAVGKDQVPEDKLELNPKVKLAAQLIKNLSNKLDLNIVNDKTTNPLGSNLVYNQDTSQPQAAQLINPQSLVGQAISAQKLSNIPADQNANSILQQGLSLRQDFSPNLANRIQWIYQQAMTSAEILMDPPELGPLSVKLRSHQGETNILFQVSNPQTKEMIEESLAKLKEMLEQQGIQLGDTQVEHRESNGNEKESSTSSHSLASTEPEIQQQNDSSVQTIGLLDTYA
ncbi:MAG: flagellar hook-length control protein FliK [Kangiellaceae bacterium]|nr:flagellar hook-length control protein FliK [Kangiellaceae bacterium]